MEISRLNESAITRKTKLCVCFQNVSKKKITNTETFNGFVVVYFPFPRREVQMQNEFISV